jgi:hypothetical protein
VTSALNVLSSVWLIAPVAVVTSVLLFSLTVADGLQTAVRLRVRLLVYVTLLILALLIAVRFYHLINP